MIDTAKALLSQLCYYSGSGNFFLIGHIQALEYFSRAEIEQLAHSISSRVDGVILLETQKPHIKMHYFNRDGSRAHMCGNGLRCSIKYMFDHFPQQHNPYFIETDCGIRKGLVLENDLVEVEMGVYDLSKIGEKKTLSLKSHSIEKSFYFLNTGVPHAIFFSHDISLKKAFSSIGREIRYHENFHPDGTNVNFVEVISSHTDKTVLKIRTYERGVEEETGACGTGATAAALIFLYTQFFPVVTSISHTVFIEFQSGEIGQVSCISNENHTPNLIHTSLRAKAISLEKKPHDTII